MNLIGLAGPRRPGRHPAPRSDQPSAADRASTLAQHPVGSTVVLGPPDLGAATTRRLGELGLRAGTEVVILHRTAGLGRVIAAGDTRIALDRATLDAWPATEVDVEQQTAPSHPRTSSRSGSTP